QEQSDLIFNNFINKDNIINIYTKLQNATPQDIDKLHIELYNIMKNKIVGIDDKTAKIHFITPDNKSFLRTHRPNEYGFDTTDIFKTATYVNKHHIKYDSFEIGKEFSAYIFIYPLKDKQNKHLGTVFIAHKYSEFTKKFMEHFKVGSNFHLKETIIDKKFSSNIKDTKYTKSVFDGFYAKKELIEKTSKVVGKEFYKYKASLSAELKALSEISQHKSTSIYDKNTNTTFTFIPIINKVTKEVEAIFSIRTTNHRVKEIIKNVQIIATFLTLIISLILFFVYFLLRTKEKEKEQLENQNKTLEETVKQKTNELQISLDTISNELIYSKTDLNGIITEVSNAFCHTSGYSKDELIGKEHSIIRHPHTDSDIYSLMWKTVAHDKVWYGKVKNSKKDGGHYVVDMAISPQYNLENKKIGYMAIMHNITSKIELAKLNDDLEFKIKEEVEKNLAKEMLLFEQSKMANIGAMIGNIAHQWRQPLSVISTTASGVQVSLDYDTFNKEDLPMFMDVILERTVYLSETIDTFRNFLKEKKELKEVVLQDRINIALGIAGVALKDNAIVLHTNIDNENKIKITMVVGELTEVIINILNNARDIILEKDIKNSWVKLELIKKDTKAIITIEDNGGGIPDDILPHIFDEYFTTKDDDKGTGLGLHMSYQIITKSIKGNLYVENTKNGAKFFIELPLG
ncbi:MAG: PAS domain-containing sensor histidine kinase, partial [Campylobacterota bacterium]|nr:PAS domain-containing sensor histidine kinase [Campylobacterota bacterium]